MRCVIGIWLISLTLAEQADNEVHGPNQLEWMDRLNNELDNFRDGAQLVFILWANRRLVFNCSLP